MTTTHCPQCGSTGVHRSRRRSRTERILALAGGRVRRCHGCNLRLLQIGGCLLRIDCARGAARRLGWVLWVAAGTALLLITILWLGKLTLTDPAPAAVLLR